MGRDGRTLRSLRPAGRSTRRLTVWEVVRHGVELEHGRAAGARLPYGESRLQPEHLAVRASERDEAAAQIVWHFRHVQVRSCHVKRAGPAARGAVRWVCSIRFASCMDG